MEGIINVRRSTRAVGIIPLFYPCGFLSVQAGWMGWIGEWTDGWIDGWMDGPDREARAGHTHTQTLGIPKIP